MPPGRRARALRSVACASQPRWPCAGSCGSAFCGSTPCPIPCQDAATGQHKVRGGSGMVTGGAGPSYMAAESHLAAVSYCPVAAIAVRLPRRCSTSSTCALGAKHTDMYTSLATPSLSTASTRLPWPRAQALRRSPTADLASRESGTWERRGSSLQAPRYMYALRCPPPLDGRANMR